MSGKLPDMADKSDSAVAAVELPRTPAPRHSAAPVAERRMPVIDHRGGEAGKKKWLLPAIGAAAALAVATAIVLWLILPPVIVVGLPTRGPAIQAIYATGTVEASATIPIAGRFTGRVTEILVDEGDAVKAGQLLVRFEDKDVLETLRQLAAQADFARQEFDRVAKLVESGAVSRSSYDRAFSDWQAAGAATARASAEADFRKLTAPTDGHVVKRDVEVGQLIPANQPILWMVRDEPLRISSAVDEEDIAQVKAGQAVLIRADAFPGKIFNGRVQSITPMGDAIARSYRVRIELTEATPFFIGMTAETNIVVRKADDALLVPVAALDKENVWKVVDGRLDQRKVTVGIRGTERVEILDGLVESDRIALKPDASFRQGSRVRIESLPSP